MLNANELSELPARLAELARPNGGALRRLDVSENGPLAASGAMPHILREFGEDEGAQYSKAHRRQLIQRALKARSIPTLIAQAGPATKAS